jgi:uncharacterized membrane protein YqjE
VRGTGRKVAHPSYCYFFFLFFLSLLVDGALLVSLVFWFLLVCQENGRLAPLIVATVAGLLVCCSAGLLWPLARNDPLAFVE